MDLIIVITISLLITISFTISHIPLFRISDEQKSQIQEKGLIHFTDPSSYIKICNIGLNGYMSNMGFPETLCGKLVWTYQYINVDDIEKKHNTLMTTKNGKTNPKRYNICISLKGIRQEDIDKLYTRYGLINDKAIVYRGNLLKPDNIELLKVW